MFVPATVLIVVMITSYGFTKSSHNAEIREEVKHHEQTITVDQKLNSIERYLKESK